MKTTNLFILISIFASQLLLAQTPGFKRNPLQKNDLSAPGREAIQERVDFDSGVMSQRHRHPGEEMVYVIEGSLEYYLEGKPPKIVNKGEVIFIPAGTIHNAKNISKGTATALATYVVEKGKPYVELVK